MNNIKPTCRKYQIIWEQLKSSKTLAIELTNFYSMSERQIEKQLKTLRRAISKEKWMDNVYKRSNPFAEITSEFRLGEGKIVFHLNPDTYDVSSMFK